MFSSFKFSSLRPRAKSFSGPSTCHGSNDSFSLCKPPRTPVASPKQKKNKKSKEVRVLLKFVVTYTVIFGWCMMRYKQNWVSSFVGSVLLVLFTYFLIGAKISIPRFKFWWASKLGTVIYWHENNQNFT